MKALKVLSNVISGRFERNVTCESCGHEFKCGASLIGCWCTEVKLDEQVRHELRSRYSDCLCRDCLQKASQSSD